MSNQENKPQTGSITGKIRSSLVLKLNLRMFGVVLSAFMSINMLLILVVSGTTFYNIEKGAQQLVHTIRITDHFNDASPTDYYHVLGYQAMPESEADPDRGFVLHHRVQSYLPIESIDARRSFLAVEKTEEMQVSEWLKQITYHIHLNIDETPYEISYKIGEDIYRLLIYLLILSIAEFLILIHNLIDGYFAIRKTLKPISEMAETAKTLNAQVASLGGTADGGSIQNLAGAISTIDASKLDKRISVDESQQELKELAQAINLMLNRISASYQSQVRFVSDASHELRTPISVIQGYVNLLDRWGKNDEKTLQESIDAIKGETDHMKNLVEQLLFLARGDNDTMQLHLEVFDVAELVEEIVKEAQMIDGAHQFQTQLNKPIPLQADRQLMKQAIRILLDNSIKYTPAEETIILKVRQEARQIKIAVQDHGIGIAPEDLPHIFDRFYRSDESRARKTGGSGLGLAIARWIIERHNGQFEVLSRLDIGTRTTIVLPAPEASVVADNSIN